MSDTAVLCSQLGKIYADPGPWNPFKRKEPVLAVAEVSFAVAKGELFGLLGPNGAGKTTLVKMLTTLILPSSGSAVVCGHDLDHDRAIRAATGLVVSDERSFFWRISARQNLEFFASLHGLRGPSAGRRVSEVLEDVDLQDKADQRFSNLSSGMRQRLAIARALLHKPQVLFLDEPTRSLDPVATQKMHALIKRLMADQEITVFLITHDLPEAEKLCNRVALMHQGRIRKIGRPEDLRRHLNPQRWYKLSIDEPGPELLEALRALLPNLTTKESPGTAGIFECSFQAGEQDGLLTTVLDLIRGQGLRIYAIHGEPPSLEDVFAHYTAEGIQK